MSVEAAVFVRFLGKAEIGHFLLIHHKSEFAWRDIPQVNFVDQHAHAKLRSIQVLQSDVCTDAEFLRRASFDVTGLPPTATEVREFLADARADKRARKIDDLLDRDEFGDVWPPIGSSFRGAIKATILSRPPNDREQLVGQKYLRDSATRAEGAKDLMWALPMSQEFLFNH